MRKLTLIALVCLLAASCGKKDWTCSCDVVTTQANGTKTTKHEHVDAGKLTVKKAEEFCDKTADDFEKNPAAGNTIEATCEVEAGDH
jgi:hypothetical protein